MRMLRGMCLSSFLLWVMLCPRARAEPHYFYKMYGKVLQKGAHSDQYSVLKGDENIFPEGVRLSISLPQKMDDFYPVAEMTFYFHASSLSRVRHFFSVKRLEVRDRERIYRLEPRAVRISKDSPRFDRVNAYLSPDGIVHSKDELEFSRGNFIRRLFDFEARPLPERLFIDYEFGIRREGGPEYVFQDTLPLELAYSKS